MNFIENKMEYQIPGISEEVAVAEVNIKVREVGKDIDEVLFKASKRVFGAGSMTLGTGVIYNAAKEEDQARAIIKGIIGVGLELVGLYLIFS